MAPKARSKQCLRRKERTPRALCANGISILSQAQLASAEEAQAITAYLTAHFGGY
jgi:hypothetical protein